MNQKGISSIAMILIIVGFLVIAGGIWYWQSQKEKPVACTQDTKLCPDGSYVSRTGPNCEFTLCPSVNISQLTKDQVLNGYDQCEQQFKNGVFEFPGGYQEWSKWDLSRYKEGKISCPPYEAITADQLVFADLDGDGINEALVSARVVAASSGGVLYVFKNDNGTARVIDTIGFGKNNVEVFSVDKDTVIVQPYVGKPFDVNTPSKQTYKFVNGKLIKQ